MAEDNEIASVVPVVFGAFGELEPKAGNRQTIFCFLPLTRSEEVLVPQNALVVGSAELRAVKTATNNRLTNR